MSTRWLLSLFVTVAAAMAQPSPAGAPPVPQGVKPPRPAPSWVDPDRTEPPLTRYRTFQSTAAGSEVSYLIYLPPDYDTQTAARYPVIYWLHGIGGGQRVGAMSGLVARMDAAIQAKSAPPVIIVFVNGMRDSWYIDTADGKRPVESMIVKDLIPHVDATYRTVATRSGRAVEGFSMGGFGAAHLGFKFSELFGTVSILGGAMLPATRAGNFAAFGAEQDYFDANSPRKLVEKNAKAIGGRTRIRVVAGDQDKAVNNGPQLFHELMERLEVAHEWSLLPGVTHDVRIFYQALNDRTEKYYAAAFQGAGR